MHAESNNIQDYLKKSEVINYDYKLISGKFRELEKDMEENSHHFPILPIFAVNQDKYLR